MIGSQWRSWWACLCGVWRRKGVRGLCHREKFFIFLPKQWGFVRFRVQERLQNRKTAAGWESCVWKKDRWSTKCKTVTCVNERRVNLSLHGVCGLGVFEETVTLAKRSFDTFAQKHRELRCGQVSTLTPLWCDYSSGKPDSLPAPSYFSVYVWRRRICDTDPQHEPVVTFYRRRPALWQPLTSTRCTRSVFSYLTVRGWCLWRRNVFNLSSPALHIREIPFLVSHATFLPFPYTCRLDSSRARPAQSKNIAIDNPID